MKLLSAIDKAMKASASKAQFISNIESLGYGVKWTDHHKYITYTTPDDQKCRDNRLFDEKYLKFNMEVYFGRLKQTHGDQRGDQGDIDRAVPAYIDWSKTRTVECAGTAYNNGRNGGSREYGTHRAAANARRIRRFDEAGDQAAQYRDRKGYEISGKAIIRNHQYQTGGDREEYLPDGIQAELEHDGENGNERSVPDKVQNEVGADWGDIASNALALAASINSMVAPPKQKKDVPGNKRKQQKKHHDREWEVER
jgi:hypothetical protein